MSPVVNIAQIASLSGSSPIFVKADNVDIIDGGVSFFGPVESTVIELEVSATDDCEVMTFATTEEALDYFSQDEACGVRVFAGSPRKIGITRGGFVAIKSVEF